MADVAYAWGYKLNGQLGEGTVTDRNAPAAVTGLTRGVSAVAAAQSASYALSSDGSIWDWGFNGNGELGLGDNTSSLTPQHLPPPTGFFFTSFDADSFSDHALATLTPTPESAGFSLIAIAFGALLARKRRHVA